MIRLKSAKLTRQNVLRGSGAYIALPALESLGYKAFASKRKSQNPPKRLIFMGMGYGVTYETWFPNKKDVGVNYKLSEGLAPLSKHKKDFTLVQGCRHKYSRQAHWGSTYWLSGANQYGTPGQSFSNTISADQVAAEQFGVHTRYSSIQLTSNATSDGHGPGLSLAWDKRGKPISGWASPLIAYHKLFAPDDMPLVQRQAMLKDKRSVLDAVLIDAKSSKKGLTQTDTDKLEEYFQSIRDIETRLSKEETWIATPKEKSPLPQPEGKLYGYREIEMMYRLMVAALQTDSTRVISYRQPLKSLLISIEAGNPNPHSVSHYSLAESTGTASKIRDKAQSKLLAGFLDHLKNTTEVDGSRLFDNVALAFGSNIRSIHYLDNCPTLLSGGAANIKLGHNMVLEEGTPLNNVWLTLLQGIGVDVQSHGDSTGLIKELQA